MSKLYKSIKVNCEVETATNLIKQALDYLSKNGVLLVPDGEDSLFHTADFRIMLPGPKDVGAVGVRKPKMWEPCVVDFYEFFDDAENTICAVYTVLRNVLDYYVLDMQDTSAAPDAPTSPTSKADGPFRLGSVQVDTERVITVVGQTMRGMEAVLKSRADREHEPTILVGPFKEGGGLTCVVKRMEDEDGKRLPNELNTGKLRVTTDVDGVRVRFDLGEFPDPSLFWRAAGDIVTELQKSFTVRGWQASPETAKTLDDIRDKETAILTAIQQQRIEQGEIQNLLDAIRRCLEYVLRAGLPADAKIREQLDKIHRDVNSDQSIQHKLEASLPIVPWLLTYKIELGASADIGAALEELKEHWEKIQSK